MSKLTETYGCVQKDTIVCLFDRHLSIEDLWNEYQTNVIEETNYPNVEFTIPNSDINVLIFDGTNFVYKPVKRIVRFNIYGGINDVYLDNDFKIHSFEMCKLLTENGFNNKIRKGMLIGIYEDYNNNKSDYCSYTDGNMVFVKVVKTDFRVIKEYGYNLEIDGHNTFIGNGIVCGDFLVNNR